MKSAVFSSTISIGGILAASSRGDGIAVSLHLDLALLFVVVGVADVAIVVTVAVGVVVLAVDCSSILMSPSLFGLGELGPDELVGVGVLSPFSAFSIFKSLEIVCYVN